MIGTSGRRREEPSRRKVESRRNLVESGDAAEEMEVEAEKEEDVDPLAAGCNGMGVDVSVLGLVTNKSGDVVDTLCSAAFINGVLKSSAGSKVE